MSQHLKRWESPRSPGRNRKGRGGSARQRQLRKRQQTLRQRLQQNGPDLHSDLQTNTITGRVGALPVIFYPLVLTAAIPREESVSPATPIEMVQGRHQLL
ncbi:MAG: hypothetical protein ACOYMP_13060 [Nodosilinea sp.]